MSYATGLTDAGLVLAGMGPPTRPRALDDDSRPVLVGVSELVDWTRRMVGKGISSPVATPVWPDMIRFKHTFVDGVSASNEESFTKARLRAIQGPGASLRSCWDERLMNSVDGRNASRPLRVKAPASPLIPPLV